MGARPSAQPYKLQRKVPHICSFGLWLFDEVNPMAEFAWPLSVSFR